MPQTARIRTASPALAELRGAIEPVEANLPPGRIQAIHDAAYELSLELFRALQGDPQTDLHALGAALHAARTQRILVKAACLDERDFAEPRAVIELETGSAALDAKYNGPWPALLASNTSLRVLRIPFREPDVDERTAFVDRMRLSWEGRAYRVLLSVGGRLPEKLAKGTAFVLSENELVRETAVALALKGYRLRPLPSVTTEPRSLSPAVASSLSAAAREIGARHYARFATPSAVSPLCDILVEAILDDAAAEASALEAWRREARRWFRPGDVILAGFPKGPSSRALWRIASDCGVAFCSFQHGVTREIASANRAVRASHEGNTSDLFMAFNRRAEKIVDDVPFSTAKGIAVGLPSEYHRAGSFRRRRAGAPPILYVSTNLYFGNDTLPQGDRSDIRKAELEVAVVDRLLSRLPHRVLYKTYPDRRYPGEDPIVERARAAANVDVFEKHVNLRYLLPDSRVIVTSRATSTTSWCLMSGKPLVFIDWPDQSPLLPDARAAFEDAVFLFDGARPAAFDDMLTLLSQPLDRIEELYRRKAQARARLIDEFFSTGGPGAGRRAAACIARQAQECARGRK